ncbi:MAG TPA: site-specific integrase [Candidatus Acidoferrales bacterium]|nr:site-specific integrase [Candidatus Acidoferrales bacterium]
MSFTGYTNKAAALRAEARRRTELLDRRAGIKNQKLAPKFREHVPTFLAWSEQQHSPKTYELHETNCDVLLRYFGPRWLDEITPGMVEEFKVSRICEARKNAKDGSTVSPATVNRALTTLKLLYHHAEKCGYAVSNPTKGVAFMKEGSGRTRVVSFEEEIAYMAQASQPLKDIAQIILDCGFRPEEVFRIKVENLDFGAGTIFNPSGKTKAARRKVTMTTTVRELLKRRAIDAKGSYVFASKNHPDRHIGSVRKAHDRAVERAGIAEHFRLYDLRHTFATRAVAANVNLPTLSTILGHTNIQMKMRYVHPAEEQKRLAAGMLETFRQNGIIEPIERSHGVTTKVTTVQ